MPLLVLPEERSKGCRCDKEYSPHLREARAELDVRTTTPASGRALSAVAQPWSTRDPDGERMLVAGEVRSGHHMASEVAVNGDGLHPRADGWIFGDAALHPGRAN